MENKFLFSGLKATLAKYETTKDTRKMWTEILEVMDKSMTAKFSAQKHGGAP